MAPGREKRARSPSEEHFEPLKKDRGSEKEPEATPTALVEAAADGDLSLVKSLISKGIDVNSGCEYKLGYSSYENVTAVVAAMEVRRRWRWGDHWWTFLTDLHPFPPCSTTTSPWFSFFLILAQSYALSSALRATGTKIERRSRSSTAASIKNGLYR